MNDEAQPPLLATLDRLAARVAALRRGEPGATAPEVARDVREAADEARREPGARDALVRLSLLLELLECASGDQPGLDAALTDFLATSLQGWCESLRGGESSDSVAAILADSSARWGEYLALLDPSLDGGPGLEPETAPDDPPTGPDDSGPVIDASDLLRMLLHPGQPTPTAGRAEPDGMPGPIPRGPAAAGAAVAPPSAPEPRRDSRANARDEAVGGLVADPAIREAFLGDAEELFERIQSLILDTDFRSQAGWARELGRCYHTLKGAAGSVGLAGLAAAIHDMEDRLAEVDGTVPPDLEAELERSLTEIEAAIAQVRGLDRSRAASDGERDEAADGPSQAPSGHGPTADGPEATPDAEAAGGGPLRVSPEQVNQLVELASELMGRRRSWAVRHESLKRFASVLRGCGHRLRAGADRLASWPVAAGDSASTHRQEGELLARRLSEIVEDLDVLARSARAEVLAMADEAEALDRLARGLWDSLQALQVCPVRGLFHRLVRVARDAARVEGRRVDVELRGESTELDRAQQDRAFEVLLHVVRNAVGHGIEPAEERSARGKAPVGRVALEARREGNAVVLAVEDDGRGIDYERVAEKGRRLGLIRPGESPPVERLNALIFQPGFSTRDRANANSGRGIGMDVVAREIGRLRGTLALTSQPGRGTRLAVRLPARLALTHAMIVRLAGQGFAVPIELIEAVHAAREVAVDRSGPVATAEVAGRRVALLDAGEALGIPGDRPRSCPTVLLVRHEPEPIAVLFDSVDGAHELIVRPLGPLLAGHPSISGTSLTTAGEIVLMLNPSGLALPSRRRGDRPGPDRRARPSALVVDDSISVRRVASRHLRALGFEVEEADDGQAALGRIRDRSFRLVLTDLEMPRMDGFQLLNELARLAGPGRVPVVVTSTRSDPDTRRRAMELGAYGFVAKPIDPEILEPLLGPLLGPRARPEAEEPAPTVA